MMIIKPTQNLSQNSSISIPDLPIWKLYENPFYKSYLHQQEQLDSATDQSRIHRLYLPISSRKIAESFWDLSFVKQVMESDQVAEMAELKAELERERKARRKLESANKRLAKELNGERKAREALERVCQELAKEISSDKANLNMMTREIEEERKMMRVADVLREERVQMKMKEAKLLMEDKMAELERLKASESEDARLEFKQRDCASGGGGGGCIVNTVVENPHIKRGIKGFVEFPRVVKAIGSKSRHLGTKLECQKAQFMILLKNRTLIRSNNLIMS